MSESTELEAVTLPDWSLAVKSVALGVKSGNHYEGANNSFAEAMGILVRMYRAFGSEVASEEIKKLVNAFTTKITDMYIKTTTECTESILKLADFSCPICFEVVEEPHTIRCGHSYCKTCLQNEVVGNQCRFCSYRFNNVDLNETKPNVLLISIADKLWPNHKKIASLRNEGNELFKQKKPEEAMKKYTDAIQLGSNDHLSLCNRAHMLLVTGQCVKALEDANQAIKHCPYWFKSYFQKAAALVCLGRFEDAFCTLTLCIYLIKVTKPPDDTTIILVKQEMVKVLLKVFSSAHATSQLSQRRRASDSSSFSPYPDHKIKHSRRPLDCSDLESPYSFDETESPATDEKSSGGLKELSSLHQSKGRSSQNYAHTGLEATVSRLHQIFSLAVQDVSSFENQMPTNDRSTNESLVSITDFECSLCYRLIYQPVSTTCGHTYCRSCLERCLDHSPTCPLCKTSLDSCLAYRRHAITYTLEQLIVRLFPKEHTDRLNQHLEELADGCTSGKNKELEIPIFVCTMAFPTVPCMLHVFEPRYRLMIRRCMESGSKRFGMCCYLQDGDHNYGDYGTMLEIRNIQYFLDGRSVVNTVGVRRFKVTKKAMKDGYNVATIEFLEDVPVEETERSRLREAHENVFKDANEWLQSINQVIRQRIITHFGNMPSPEEDWLSVVGGPAWTWWLLAILPLDAKAQLAILSMNSLLKRLESLQKVLRYVKTRLT